jgi:hypothetical protein
LQGDSQLRAALELLKEDRVMQSKVH